MRILVVNEDAMFYQCYEVGACGALVSVDKSNPEYARVREYMPQEVEHVPYDHSGLVEREANNG